MKIAEKNIQVYKVLNIIGLSPYYQHQYKIGEITKNIQLKLEPIIEDNSRYQINEGYHSYSISNEPRSYDMEHFTFFRELLYNKNWHRVYYAIIPKGTKYYENDYGEIVSEQLIVTKKYISVD